jgi:type I restriction enzyme S subunit
MMMFRVRPDFDPSYFMWVLNSESIFQQVLQNIGGATSPHINISEIVNFALPAPPLNEQGLISSTIQEQVNKIDSLLAEAEGANRLLDEHRSALISAAVTGKIDVRGSSLVEDAA